MARTRLENNKLVKKPIRAKKPFVEKPTRAGKELPRPHKRKA